jgi:uncharacterized membrane protein YdjX (TVP38/TMEM64 family)
MESASIEALKGLHPAVGCCVVVCGSAVTAFVVYWIVRWLREV